MARIRLDGVDKVYPGGVHAVRGLDLTVDDGKLLVLLGPAGCGKSTVLRLVAGLEPLTGGRILLGDRRIDHERPDRRDVAMVFQSYALYGHMSVRDNIEFPLRMRGVGRRERGSRAEEVARLLELGPLLEAKPAALSGGQRQRVAMARALVRRPAAFLLDEPLSNLDVRLRTHVREEIREIQRTLGVTTVHVTHDQTEALSLGDRVAILREGELQQVGPGQALYDRPANTFVAAFLGQPGMNLLPGRLVVTGTRAGDGAAKSGRLTEEGCARAHPEGDADRVRGAKGAGVHAGGAGGWGVELPGVEGPVPVGDGWAWAGDEARGGGDELGVRSEGSAGGTASGECRMRSTTPSSAAASGGVASGPIEAISAT